MDTDTIIFIGRSGSGKGTQVTLLKEKIQQIDGMPSMCYLETGASFREFIKQDRYTNQLTKEFMNEGKLVPDIITDWLFINTLVENLSDGQLLVLDGFPRTLHQVQTLTEACSYYNRKKPKVIHIDVSETEVRTRLVARARDDDQDMKKIDTRIAWYNENVIPALDALRKSAQFEVIDINGEQSPEDVHEDIIKALNL